MKKLISIALVFVCLLAISAQSFAFDFSSLGDFVDALDNLTEEDNSSSDSEKTSEDIAEFEGPLVEVDIGGETIEVHEDFKQYMDDFEAFFDEYVEIMSEDDPDEFALLEMMTEYLEMIESMDALSDAELSEGDLAYYLAITTRIYAKLATVE